MNIQYIKALHIISVVTWFAGLFYIVRLFIYHTEAEQRPLPERKILQDQFKIMEKRLWYGITYPSMIVVLLSGLYMAFVMNVFSSGWMMVKLCFVTGLLVYHFLCGVIYSRFRRGNICYSSGQLRIWNEVATVFLVAIVFLAVVKTLPGLVGGLSALALLVLLLLAGIRGYRSLRKKNKE